MLGGYGREWGNWGWGGSKKPPDWSYLHFICRKLGQRLHCDIFCMSCRWLGLLSTTEPIICDLPGATGSLLEMHFDESNGCELWIDLYILHDAREVRWKFLCIYVSVLSNVLELAVKKILCKFNNVVHVTNVAFNNDFWLWQFHVETSTWLCQRPRAVALAYYINVCQPCRRPLIFSMPTGGMHSVNAVSWDGPLFALSVNMQLADCWFMVIVLGAAQRVQQTLIPKWTRSWRPWCNVCEPSGGATKIAARTKERSSES